MTKKVLNMAIYVIILIIFILFLYCIIQRKVSGEIYTNICGYTFLEVMTGSMSGTLEIGDGVVVKLTNNVKENDIIVYKKDNVLITHRLVENNGNQLIAKGDANNIQDDPISSNMVIGKVVYKISNIDYYKKIICFFIIIMICLIIIFNIKNKKQKEKDK